MVTEIRRLSREQLRGDRGAQLLRYLLQRGADEFSITVMALQDTQAPFADAFEDELAPFERAPDVRPVATKPDCAEAIREVRLWSFTEDSLVRLLSFLDDDIVMCPAGPDGWLEDLAVYRDGALVLGVTSHEQEGELWLTRDEQADVARLGVLQ